MELATFVPLAAGGSSLAPGRVASLRGTAAEAPPAGPSEASGLGLLAPLGITCAGLGLAKQRGVATQRRFFGGGSAPPPPKVASSYKDYADPWLGSADLGFDPLNLSTGSGIFDTAATAVPETTYYNYRESEVKHGRFAMAAFLAIFFEAADRGAVLKQLGVASAQDTLDATLGLDEVQGPVLILGLGVQALAEFNLQKSETDGNFLSVEYNRDRCPGDPGFDPLGLTTGPGANKVGVHNVEVNLGRLAMIGLTSFLVREFALKQG